MAGLFPVTFLLSLLLPLLHALTPAWGSTQEVLAPPEGFATDAGAIMTIRWDTAGSIPSHSLALVIVSCTNASVPVSAACL